MISPYYLALATAAFLCSDLAVWIGLIAIEPTRRIAQIKMALFGLLVTGLMGFGWFLSRSSDVMLEGWTSIWLTAFVLVAFGGLVVAILRMRIRLKQRE